MTWRRSPLFCAISLDNVTLTPAWENSRHFATLVSPKNCIPEPSAEISYWWCVTNWICVVLLASPQTSSGVRLSRIHKGRLRGGYSSSEWLKQILLTQIWVVTRHQYGISALVSQTSLRGKSSGGVTKCWLYFSGYPSPNPIYCTMQEVTVSIG